MSSTPIYIDANGTGAIGSVNATNVPALAFFLRPQDNGRILTNPVTMSTSNWDSNATNRIPAQAEANAHLEGANYAFADGHVKWFKGQGADSSKAACRELDYDGDGDYGGCTNLDSNTVGAPGSPSAGYD